MVIVLIIKEKIWDIKISQRRLYCPALSFLRTLVLEDQMFLDWMSVPPLLSCGVQSLSLSLSLSHLYSRSSITWTTLQIATQVLQTAQCPGWRRLTECATVGSEIKWHKLDMNAALRMLTDLNLTAGISSMFLLGLLTGLLRRACRPSFSWSSLTDKALGRSCLLASTSKTASFNSSSAS